MKSRLALAVLPLALAACSGGDAGNGTAAAPVAAVTAPAGTDWTTTVAKTEEGYRLGNPDAAIKLVEYGARTCPTCGAFARAGNEPLIRNYVSTGKVSFEFRDFLVHGAPDLALAVLGQCGGADPFFPLMEQMYADQSAFLDRLQALPADQQARIQAAGPTQALTLLAEAMGAIDFVKQRGIPEAQARQCLTNQQTIEAVAKPSQTATEKGSVTGTPTFLINDEVVPGVVAWPQLEAALKARGA